jgi:hypothetical protein
LLLAPPKCRLSLLLSVIRVFEPLGDGVIGPNHWVERSDSIARDSRVRELNLIPFFLVVLVFFIEIAAVCVCLSPLKGGRGRLGE